MAATKTATKAKPKPKTATKTATKAKPKPKTKKIPDIPPYEIAKDATSTLEPGESKEVAISVEKSPLLRKYLYELGRFQQKKFKFKALPENTGMIIRIA